MQSVLNLSFRVQAMEKRRNEKNASDAKRQIKINTNTAFTICFNK